MLGAVQAASGISMPETEQPKVTGAPRSAACRVGTCGVGRASRTDEGPEGGAGVSPEATDEDGQRHLVGDLHPREGLRVHQPDVGAGLAALDLEPDAGHLPEMAAQRVEGGFDRG